MSKLFYKELEFELLYNAKLKHTYIKIEDDGKVVVKTASKSEAYLYALLEKKERWIRKQLEKRALFKVYDFVPKKEVLLYGERQSIESVEAQTLREKLEKKSREKVQNIAKYYDDFYKQVCRGYLQERVKYYAGVMQLEYKELRFRKMRARWGSCSAQKVLTFNSELIKIEKELIDYVVVHELAHLVHMNHSRAFHALVERYLKNNAKDLRKKLHQVRLQAFTE